VLVAINISLRWSENEFNAIRTPFVQAEFSANAEKAARARKKTPVIQRELQLALSVQPFKCGTWEQTNVTLRIEKDSDGKTTTLRLIGRIRREHVEVLKAQIKAEGTSVTLDLTEVSLVDLDVIRFLAACQTEGISLVHCSRYINNWIAKERFRGQ
jgi:hypothetical protein